MARDWPRHAKALDLHLQGKSLRAIAVEFGVSKQRVSQLIHIAKEQLAWRVFGVKRPWKFKDGRWQR